MKKFNNFIIFAATAILAIACKGTNEGKPDTITVKPAEIEALKGTYRLPFEYGNSSEYREIKVSCDADWVSDINVEPNSVRFNAGNNFGDARLATFTFSVPGQKDVAATVIQSAFDSPYFSIDVNNITSYTCIANITPNASKAPGNYYYIVLNKSSVDESLVLETHEYGSMEFGEAVYQNELEYIKKSAAEVNMTIAEWLSRMGGLYKVTSSAEKTEMPYGNTSPLTYNTDYYLICFGMTTEGVRTSPVVLKQFTTLPLNMVNMKFEATVSNIGSYNADIVMTPSNNDEYYFWTYVSDFQYEELGNDIYAVMANMVKNIKSRVNSGASITAMLQKGKNNSKLSNLWEGTTYHIVAWGMDLHCSPITEPVEVTTFKTPAMEITDNCTFKIETLEIKQQDFKFRVTPSNNDTRYYIAPVHKYLTEGYTNDQFAQRVINMETKRINDRGNGETWANTGECKTGTTESWANKDLGWVVRPDKDYVIFVFGVGPDGKRTTKVSTAELHSNDASQSDMTFNVTFDEIRWNNITYTVTPSKDDERYLPFLIATSELDNNGYRKPDGTLEDKAVMTAIEEYYAEDGSFAIDYASRIKTSTIKGARVMSNTDYSLLICGYAGSNTTRFYEFKFKAPEIPFGKADVDIELEKFELFDGAELAKLDEKKWHNYQERSVLYVKFKTTGDCKKWYAGMWQPISHFKKDGGIDYVTRLVQMENVFGNNIYYPAKEGWIAPFWKTPYEENRPWTDDNGNVCSTVPWAFYYYAEGENGNYGKFHCKYFLPRKTEAEKKDWFDITPIPAYDFWSEGGLRSTILSAPKTDVRMEPIFKARKK